MNVRLRQMAERKIVRRVLKDALKAGYLLNVDNGGDKFELPKPTAKMWEIWNAMFATDDERLYLYRKGQDWRKGCVGWVWFVYGNDGWDVICDATCDPTMDALLKGAEAVGEQLCERMGG